MRIAESSFYFLIENKDNLKEFSPKRKADAFFFHYYPEASKKIRGSYSSFDLKVIKEIENMSYTSIESIMELIFV